VGGAERDGRRLAVVLLRGERNPEPLGDQAAKLLDYGFRLAATDVRPIGELVDRAPDAQPKQSQNDSEDADNGDAVREPVDDASGTVSASAERSAFGNVGLPLVLLAGLAAFVTLAMWFRRRRARLARANRTT